MRGRKLQTALCRLIVIASLFAPSLAPGAPRPETLAKIDGLLNNLMTLNRPGKEGLATLWDGNKYVQCRYQSGESELQCEAGGARLQPSLSPVLTPKRIADLKSLGWELDSHFGNYVHTFKIDETVPHIRANIVAALKQGYDANIAQLDMQSDWIAIEACPPRNGPGQNLAGMINDAPEMAATAIHDCAYAGETELSTADDLIDTYGEDITAEIQRLRVNINRRVFLIIDAGAGYLQCETQTEEKAIYCEAASAYSVPLLKHILTPERIAKLHAAGFADPGRAPNYWKLYRLNTYTDAAVATEILTLLHDAYDYHGDPDLALSTEKGKED